VGIHCVILEGVCWDKDRIGKDYMGEFDVMLEDIFADGITTQEVRWNLTCQMNDCLADFK
jgi:phosphatidylserine decarboxylase